MKKLFLAVAMSFVAVVSAAAQGVTGEWDASMNTPGGVSTFRIVLKQEGEKLTGTAKRAAGDAALEGTVIGNKVTFAYSIAYGGSPMTITMTTVLTGDEMKGQVDFGGRAQDEFSAKRVAGAKAQLVDPVMR